MGGARKTLKNTGGLDPQQDALTDAELRASPVEVTTAPRENIAGLSFVQALSALGNYQTSWVDVTDWKWLDFDVEVETADAVTALLEFTNAPDPNVTPPGANDIVRALTQTVAGTAISGLSTNILSFGIPAQMSWARAKATDLTGGQTIKVTTYGQIIPPVAALLPIAAGITSDFRAALVQSVEKGFDPSNTFQSRRFSGIVSAQSSTTTLPATNTFLGSAWTSTTGFVGVAILIKSAANSAADGLKVLFSTDSSNTHYVGGPVTYDATPDGRVYKFGIPIPGVTFKVSLTAGASDMTSLVLKTYLLAEATEDSSLQLSDVPTDATVADVIKAQMIGKKDSGSYGNVGITNSGNFKAAIAEHVVETPIKALSTLNINQLEVGTAAVEIPFTSTGRKTIAIKALIGNTDEVYINKTNAVTTGNGWELSAGEPIEFDITEGLELWAISASAAQRVCWAEVAD